MRKKSVNIDIAFTHIFTRKKQTLVACLGVTLGVAVYLFMNSLSGGFSVYSRGEIFKNSAHIKIYKEDKISKPFIESSNENELVAIVNPQITTLSKTLVNPQGLLDKLKKQGFLTHAIAQVNVDVFYNNGKSQLKGTANGVNVLEADAMFNIRSYMVGGSLKDLQGNLGGIVIGKGIAEKLNVRLNDNITVSSSYGITKTLKVKGIFSTGSALSDQSKSYINISTAQQFVKEGPSYVTTIYANTLNPDAAPEYAKALQQLTEYKVEPWQVTNADVLSGDLVRNTMMGAISLSILVVAAFGIYNILNMTVMQKINDIAILKATGFSGGDVIKIFVTEALVMGFLGCLMGLVVGGILIAIMQNVWMGPPVGYFPIYFSPQFFMSSFLLGILATLGAGYIPARKASKVDPVEIFRK
ncbi:MAG: ABC transporter permease [Cytophagales bacterium]|jgi:lipoprotein-releasing system permease protein|nr:ABC transporter permease [Cytophagales bacterium]MCA6366435.1 ABC transporter permease [Cytophagales bacterium]MCA6373098.1 ABC transporter permease [Cytophagales bacterium]MCA6375540.1 ABC transporter permease [Cytophagales bacterium]MCA6382873.1 ABC transporter permease [Cytophagales bacterium]